MPRSLSSQEAAAAATPSTLLILQDVTNNTLQDVTVTTARPTIIIYTTISPESVVIPIICSIIIFPLVVAAVIFLLRHYNRRARAKDKFRSAYQQGAKAIFSLSKIGTSQTVGQKKGESLSGGGKSSLQVPLNRFQCMPELELDTVMEERDDDDDDDESSSDLRSAVATLERQHEQSGAGRAAMLRTRAEVNARASPTADIPAIVLHEASPEHETHETHDMDLMDRVSEGSEREDSRQSSQDEEAAECAPTVASVVCFGLDMLSGRGALAAVASTAVASAS